MDQVQKTTITFRGSEVEAFLDGRGFAFDYVGNSYQEQNLVWVLIRRRHQTLQHIVKPKGKIRNPKVGFVIGRRQKLKF